MHSPCLRVMWDSNIASALLTSDMGQRPSSCLACVCRGSGSCQQPQWTAAQARTTSLDLWLDRVTTLHPAHPRCYFQQLGRILSHWQFKVRWFRLESALSMNQVMGRHWHSVTAPLGSRHCPVDWVNGPEGGSKEVSQNLGRVINHPQGSICMNQR